MKLPKDKTKITKRQYRQAVCGLAKTRSLRDLQRQHARIQQRERKALNKGDRQLADQLDVLERITGDAVFEHEFGPVLCPRRQSR